MTKQNNRSTVRDKDQYEALRDQGASKEKAARIANTEPSDMDRDSRPYETRNKQELYDRARQIGIEGRSRMSKDELIAALRNH